MTRVDSPCPGAGYDWSTTSLDGVIRVGAYEAKTHLSRLIDEVEGGQTVVITKHGRDVAKLIAAQPAAADPGEVIDALRAARRGVKRRRTSVRSMIEDGRR